MFYLPKHNSKLNLVQDKLYCTLDRKKEGLPGANLPPYSQRPSRLLLTHTLFVSASIRVSSTTYLRGAVLPLTVRQENCRVCVPTWGQCLKQLSVRSLFSPSHTVCGGGLHSLQRSTRRRVPIVWGAHPSALCMAFSSTSQDLHSLNCNSEAPRVYYYFVN